LNSWSAIFTLARFWMKGRFTKATAIWMAIGEVFSVVIVLFVGTTFLSFYSRFSLSGGLSYIGLSLVFALFLVGLIQSGFNGSGLPVTAADVDYVFTSPIRPRAIFAAKVLMNSFTTVILSFPPILALYLRYAASYGTPIFSAILAGLVTLAFFVLCLLFSADITLSLNSRFGDRLKTVRNALLVAIAVLSLLPLGLLIAGAPPILAQAASILPSGLAAQVSFGLVSGVPWDAERFIDIAVLGLWFVILLSIGLRLSRQNFIEVVQIYDPNSEVEFKGARVGSTLKTDGKSLWSVVRAKERIVMSRTKETRSLFINALFLSGFMVIYSLSGVFQSSPTSFLFVLFIIGSFGSANATRWLEKERLWLIKTSAINLKRYVLQVYRARITPMLLVLAPVAAGVGAPLLLENERNPEFLVTVGLSLPAALEIAALTMAGGMYFAARYGQSSNDDTLTSQGQDLANVKRFLYQSVINLCMVAPLLGMVLSAGPLLSLVGDSETLTTGIALSTAALVYTVVILRFVMDRAGDSLEEREDL